MKRVVIGTNNGIPRNRGGTQEFANNFGSFDLELTPLMKGKSVQVCGGNGLAARKLEQVSGMDYCGEVRDGGCKLPQVHIQWTVIAFVRGRFLSGAKLLILLGLQSCSRRQRQRAARPPETR